MTYMNILNPQNLILTEQGDAWINNFLITTQAKRNLSSRSGIGGVRSAT